MRSHRLLAVEDDLPALAGVDQDRRGPAAALGRHSRRLPECLAGLFVQPHEQTLTRRVTVLDHQVANDDRRGPCSPGAGKRAEVARPQWLALDGVTVNAALAEKRDDSLAVCRAR